MQQEFIPYAEALAMKELGFNEKCLRFHHVDGKLNEVSFPEDIGAPLYQQVFRWFREKYKLACAPVYTNDKGEEWWYFRWWYLEYGKTPPKNRGEYAYETYEEAQLICLQQLIKIIQPL